MDLVRNPCRRAGALRRCIARLDINDMGGAQVRRHGVVQLQRIGDDDHAGARCLPCHGGAQAYQTATGGQDGSAGLSLSAFIAAASPVRMPQPSGSIGALAHTFTTLRAALVPHGDVVTIRSRSDNPYAYFVWAQFAQREPRDGLQP